jgi:protein-disulfide isomerase
MRAVARLGLLVLVLVLGGAAACAEVPPSIKDEMATTAREKPGAATVVFFTDFQCPFCRVTHARLAPLLARRGGLVRVVLRHVPLPRHPDARGAARAAICFERLVGAGPELDGYADELFKAPDLSPAACTTMAEQHGVDRARFDACVADPATEERIARDLMAFDAVRGDGVPLLYIGTARLEGAQPVSDLADALDRAAR